MAIDPKDLVDYAHKMLTHDASEIVFRNVVNRAYYGAFLVARDAAKISNTSGSVHRHVADHYRNNHRLKVSNNLDNLKRLRHIPDYEPQKEISHHQANNSCRTAIKILRELEN